VADALVEEANPSTNYDMNKLRVEGAADPTIESYLRFEVRGVSGTVSRALLRLWVPAGGTANGPAVFTATNTWTQRGINWGNRPRSTGPL